MSEPQEPKENKSVALLVHSCDRYEFLFKGFEFFFSRFWDFSIPTRNYFATEEKSVEITGFRNIKSGKGQWSDRLRLLLTKLEEDYVLYFQEDMWLTKPVSTTFFKETLDFAIRNKINCLKLHSADVYKTTSTDTVIEGLEITALDNKASNFLMSHQVTLWNKDFLIEQLHKDEHPWRNERKGTKRLKKLGAPIHQVDYFAENGNPPINQNPDTSSRSEYFTVSINGTLNERTERYIEMLSSGNEEEKKYAQQLQFHYQNKLTHDGKPKPRKDDIFKKIKNWIKNR